MHDAQFWLIEMRNPREFRAGDEIAGLRTFIMLLRVLNLLREVAARDITVC